MAYVYRSQCQFYKQSRIVLPGKDEGNWLPLEKCPFNYMIHLIKINDDEILAFSARNIDDADGIYKYNVLNNTWSRIINWNENIGFDIRRFPRRMRCIIAFDESKTVLYVCDGDRQKIYELDLKSKSIKEYAHGFDMISYIVCIGENLHILIRDYTKRTPDTVSHYVFNTNTKKFLHIHSVDSLSIKESGATHVSDLRLFCDYRKSVFLKSDSCLVTFDYNNSVTCKYKFKSSEWTSTKIKQSNKRIYDAAVVAACDERHLISMGGFVDGRGSISGSHGFIRVYGSKRSSFTLLNIKCPASSGRLQAFTMGNKKRDELMAFGFVNQCFASSEFQNIQKLPYYMVRLIAEWISNEWIHLIDEDDGKHWKIHIDEIICDYIEIQKGNA